jgi:uncharacterized protein (TIGR03546 family)
MLPTPLAYLKKTLAILKSSLTPTQIALSISLGMLAGLPPMGLHIIIPCTLALLLRCSFRGFLFSLGLFKLISLPLAPASYQLGQFLLDERRAIDPFWRWFVHQPVLAPMGYSRFLLLGSLVVAFLLAIPVFVLVRMLVIRYRSSVATRMSGWAVSRRLRRLPGAAVARRFLLGGEAKYIEPKTPWGPFRWIRKEMLIGLPLVYGVCYLLAALLVPFFAGGVATSTASWVTGTEIAADESSFSLFTGRLTMRGFVVQDPKTPSENIVEIPSLTLDAGMLPLLSKRVVFNAVEIEEASLHVVREEDGTLNLDNAASGWNVEGYLTWAAENARKVDWLGLLRRFVQYLSEVRPLAPRGDPYARWRGGRSFAPYEPPFTIERIIIGTVHVRLEDRQTSASGLPPLTLLEVELRNVAFPHALNDDPMLLALRGQFGDDPQSGLTLSAEFDVLQGAPLRTYGIEARRIDLASLAAAYETTLPVTVVSGRATLKGSLIQEGEVVGGSVELILEDLILDTRDDATLFGLDAELSGHVIEGWNRYAERLPIVIGFAIGGSASEPAFEWEAALLEVAREGLLMAGRTQLAGVAEQLGLRIEDLGGVPEMALDEDYEALRESTQRAAVDLIRGAVPAGPEGEIIDSLLELLQSQDP